MAYTPPNQELSEFQKMHKRQLKKENKASKTGRGYNYDKQKLRSETAAGATKGGLQGAAAGATVGAAIGSALPVPIVGTAVGAGIGALAGAISSGAVRRKQEKIAQEGEIDAKRFDRRMQKQADIEAEKMAGDQAQIDAARAAAMQSAGRRGGMAPFSALDTQLADNLSSQPTTSYEAWHKSVYGG